MSVLDDDDIESFSADDQDHDVMITLPTKTVLVADMATQDAPTQTQHNMVFKVRSERLRGNGTGGTINKTWDMHMYGC